MTIPQLNMGPTAATSHKVVIIGDGGTGKTCILEVFKSNHFPEEYIPTIVDNFIRDIHIQGEKIPLAIWDTAGQEVYSYVRTMTYADTEAVVLCYAIDSRTSFSEIKAKWVPEIKNYVPNAPYILVALKTDLRTNAKSDEERDLYISEQEGRRLSEEIGACAYIEASARINYNVVEIFEEVGNVVYEKSYVKKKKRWWSCFFCGLC